MKKCNVFRGTLVLLTSVTLLNGCAKTEKENRNKDLMSTSNSRFW